MEASSARVALAGRLPPGFALVKFALSLTLAGYGRYELHRDEYLYLDYGRHLAWGYLEVPPLTAGQSWLTLALGGGFFWVKFWPALWGSLTVFVVVRLAQRMGGGRWAQALAGLCYLSTVFGRLNLLFQPNSFEVLSFTLATYLVVRHAQPDGRPRHLYALGLVLGLGVLNKFTTFFFGAALLGALLLARPRLLARRELWLAVALAALVAAPTLLWQVTHGLPFRHHMALLQSSQLVHVDLAGFWRDQLLMCSPALPVWGAGLVAALRGRPQPAARTAGWIYVFGLLILTVLHGKSYYALAYYPALFAVGAVWWEARLAAATPRWTTAGRVALLLTLLVLQLPPLPYFYPVLPPPTMARLSRVGFYQAIGVNRWEDGRAHELPQDYADMLGWQEMADKTWQAYQALPPDAAGHTLIKCDNYGQAGAINYYNRDRNLPAATSFNGSYVHWFPAAPAGGWRYLLLIGEDDPEELRPYFQSWRQVGVVTNPNARERGTTVFVGVGPSPALLARAEAERQEELAAWEGNLR